MSDKLHIEYESTPAAHCAYYDPEGPIGRGKTREDAVIDLLEQTEEALATVENAWKVSQRRIGELSNEVTMAVTRAEKVEAEYDSLVQHNTELLTALENPDFQGWLRDWFGESCTNLPDHHVRGLRAAWSAGKAVSGAYAEKLIRAAMRALHWEIAEGAWSLEQPERDALRAILAQGYPGSGDQSAANAAIAKNTSIPAHQRTNEGPVLSTGAGGIGADSPYVATTPSGDQTSPTPPNKAGAGPACTAGEARSTVGPESVSSTVGVGTDWTERSRFKPGDRVLYTNPPYGAADKLMGELGTVIGPGGTPGVWKVRLDDFEKRNKNQGQGGCYGAEDGWLEFAFGAPSQVNSGGA